MHQMLILVHFSAHFASNEASKRIRHLSVPAGIDQLIQTHLMLAIRSLAQKKGLSWRKSLSVGQFKTCIKIVFSLSCPLC